MRMKMITVVAPMKIVKQQVIVELGLAAPSLDEWIAPVASRLRGKKHLSRWRKQKI
jgi:hypothetical protein